MNKAAIAYGAEDAQINRWYIAQYRVTRSIDAVHVIIREDAIILVKDNSSNQSPKYVKGQEIYVRTAATVYRPGHIVYVAPSYEDACQQLMCIKIWCLQMIYDPPVMEFWPHCHDSMLVQYETETNCINYNIVGTDFAVVEAKRELYQAIVIKIKIKNRIINAKIIRISNDTIDLKRALTFMKLKCIDGNPPKAIIPTVKIGNNAVKTNNAVTAATDPMSLWINAMEAVMHKNCREILEAFEKHRRLRIELQRRKYNLYIKNIMHMLD